MRRLTATLLTIASAITALGTPGSTTAANEPSSIGRVGSAGAAPLAAAERFSRDPITVDANVRDVAIVGDSILADTSGLGGPANSTVGLVGDALRSHRSTHHLRVRNLAAPGIANLFPAGPGFGTLGTYLTDIFRPPAELPDLVIIAISSIDLNARPDDSVEVLGPPIVTELEQIRRRLEALGMDAVFVPVFGGNTQMFNVLKNSGQPTFRDYMLNARIEQFNAIVTASDLPLLFDRFRQLDLDGDGSADRTYFVGRPGPGTFDDGVHPNRRGEALYALHLIDGVIAAVEAG